MKFEYNISLHKLDGDFQAMGEYSFPVPIRVGEYLCFERGEDEYKIDTIVNSPDSLPEIHLIEIES